MPMATRWPAATTPNSIPPTRHGQGDPAPVLKALADAGIDMVDVTDQPARGVDKFVEPMEKLLEGIAPSARRSSPSARRRSTLAARRGRRAAVAKRVKQAAEEDVARRIWRKDDTLWGPPASPRCPTASGG
jgi:hypothetical protein